MIFFKFLLKTLIAGTQSMVWSKNKKNVYPYKPQFYYIKVGCKGVFVTRTCFRDVKQLISDPSTLILVVSAIALQ